MTSMRPIPRAMLIEASGPSKSSISHYEPFPRTEKLASPQSRSGKQSPPEQWLLPTASLGTPR